MLVLSRKNNESVVINGDITVTVVEIREDKVRLAFVVPKDASVHRQEVFDAIHGKTATGASPMESATWRQPRPQGFFAGGSLYEHKIHDLMQLASEVARELNHGFVGTEHILLGLMKEGWGVAGKVLKALDIDLASIRGEVEKIVMPGLNPVAAARLPLTPRAKKVLEFAREEAHDLAHNDVSIEHVLIGLVREKEGVAAQVLVNLGLSPAIVRRKVLEVLGHPAETNQSPERDAAFVDLAAPASIAMPQTPDVPEAIQSLLKEYDRQIERLQSDKEAAVVLDDAVRAAYLRDQIRKLTQSREILTILFRGP